MHVQYRLRPHLVGVSDPKWDKVGKAFVVLKPGATLAGELIEYCRKRLAKHNIPKYVEFRTELPRTTAGTILKRELGY